MTARTVKEWIGKSPDAMPSPKVRQRILERHNSECHICGGKIDGKSWDADHVIPLKDGGENRESNLKPAHRKCHRLRTATQAVERAPIERKKLKHSGAKRPKQSIKSAGFAKVEKPERVTKGSLPPKMLYGERE